MIEILKIIKNRIIISAPFEEKEIIKELKTSKWHPEERKWSISDSYCSYCNLMKHENLILFNTDPGIQLWKSENEKIKNITNDILNNKIPWKLIVKTPPWKHQIQISCWIEALDSCLIYAGMGCGKTKATIDAIYTFKYNICLIVSPKAVRSVWIEECERHFPDSNLFCAILNGKTTKKKAEELQKYIKIKSKFKIIITNYESIWRQPLGDLIKKIKWNAIILDESQRIKSPGGKSSIFCKGLKKSTKKLIALSGTPMPHSPLDAYAQFRALDDALFGTSLANFRNTYAVMGGFENKQIVKWQRLDELKEKMKIITIQVSRDNLDLPESLDTYREVEFNKEEQDIYNKFEKTLILEIKSGIITAQNALVKLLKLQQITSGNIKTEDNKVVKITNSKINALRNIIDDIDINDSIVVFCRFTADMHSINQVSNESKRKYFELSGRKNEINEWKKNNTPDLICIQIQTGKEGISLVKAHYAIYYSLGYSLGDYEQSKARIHRPGQKVNVLNIHLVVKNTVDEQVYSSLRDKKNVVKSVLEGLNNVN